jgi:hypothetical protein
MIEGLQQLNDNLTNVGEKLGGDMLAKACTIAADKLLLRIKETCPVGHEEDAGALRNSFEIKSDLFSLGHAMVNMGSDKEYAAAIEYGAREHEIFAKDGGVLAFAWAGVPSYFTHVEHPAFTGVGFVRRSLDSDQGEVLGAMANNYDLSQLAGLVS